MKRIYLIGGTMGVGKTTVCQALKRELPRSVFLDGDWCWDASPFQVTEETKAMVLDNICHVLNNFLHCSAYDHIIFCWVMHQQAIIDAILSGLDAGACDARCVSLTAGEAAVRERLAADIARGIRAPDALERSLSRLPLYRSLDTVKIDTTGKSVQAIAGEIAAL